jgi:multicomponent Na+:H+ antiporter subunit F
MYILWVMLVFLALCIVRVIKGPSIWDRLLGVNLIYSKIVIIIIVFSSFQETAYLLDLAIIYVLLSFISTFFTARFLLGRAKGRNNGNSG